MSEIDNSLTEMHSKQDSEIIIAKFIDNWILDRIILNESRKHSRKNDELNRLVEDYKSSLMVHNFENHYLETTLDTVVFPGEIQEYYLSKKEQFELDESIVRLFLVKVPIETASDTLQNLWETEDLPALKSYINYVQGFCILDINRWFYETEIKSLVPEALFKKISFKRAAEYDYSDEKFKFYVKILEIIKENEEAPVSFFNNSIRQRILRNRSRNLLSEMRNKLYKEKIKSKNIKIYSNSN